MSKFKRLTRDVARTAFRFAAANDVAFLNQMASAEQVHSVIETLRITPVDVELIRFGGGEDGGYLVPDDLPGITACFSPGVWLKCTFEDAITARLGIPCFMADYSVNGPPSENPLFDFEKKFVGTLGGDEFIDFEDWIKEKMGDDTSSDLLLQMDIEGGEYDVLGHISEKMLNRFRIILLEVHALEHMFSRVGAPLMSAFFRKLTKNHYLIHNHPNNNGGMESHFGIDVPRVMEITLLRKDRARPVKRSPVIPHPLDRPNIASKPDIILSKLWY